MSDINERYKTIDLPESTKKVRLGKYYNLMKEGYSPNEILTKSKI